MSPYVKEYNADKDKLGNSKDGWKGVLIGLSIFLVMGFLLMYMTSSQRELDSMMGYDAM